MADMPQQPQPPPGFQRPGIPGAGNILDPEVRGELRGQIQEAVRGAAPQPGAAAPQVPQAEAPAPVAPAPAAAAAEPAAYRAGPFPHGDVDLRGFAANVPPGPVRPRRGSSGRRFYFLREAPADASPTEPVAVRAGAAPRPG